MIIGNQWPKKSVGRKMIFKVPIIRSGQTLEQARDILFSQKDIETINYFYVVDEEKKLLGIFSIKEIYHLPKETKVEKIMEKAVIKINPETDQEQAAYLAIKNNIKSVPIIDKNNVLLGILPSDQILKIIYKETQKDILQLGGISRAEINLEEDFSLSKISFLKSVLKSFTHRIPWLLLGLIGGLLIAKIIGFFTTSLEKNILLAAFIPLIVYISGAAGTQIQTLIIRELALSPKLLFKKYFLKQLVTTVLVAIVCGFLLSLITFVIYQKISLGIILGISIFFAISSAIFSGLIIPYIFNKIKIDPAIASGPLGTIIQDTLSVVIYFSVANFLL
ncbi:MAG: magnesium transporter [Patescibacteria group bacterium]|jgi:magnesium transporter|nr:magnesium transporter [Patescibacteria group bacterium]MDD5172711.1 magnesium transporter [Patescibacteria group bacterium]